MIDTDKYTGHIENIGRWQMFANALPRWAEDADRKLVQDAPLLLEEVKRLRERLMLAESALGEVRACHEDGQGNLGEILEHYRDKEGVEMPNAFDEVKE